MPYREIIAVCSEIHTKHINTLCGHNVELLDVKLAVHIVTTGFKCRLERPAIGRSAASQGIRFTYGQRCVIRGLNV